jgi:ABC-type polysaccharide/polyol phosphate transport system ATPase subunit
MSTNAVVLDGVWKSFRLYHEKNQYLKTALLRGGRAQYEDFWALNDLNLEIPQGSTYGIIGANGSGKSTLLKCLAGILTPNKGSITVNGRLAALLELGAGFHPDLTGRENIYLNGAILGMSSKDITQKIDEIVEFAGLEQFIDNPVKNYSSGMTVRLGFSIAINVDPEILIIDEVLAVGDTEFQQKCYEKIEDFRHDGRTIILVSHGLGDVARLCSTVAWIEKGHLRMEGDGYEVVNDYLGVSHNAQVRTSGEVGERWGSGEVTISKVEFVDRSGKELGAIETGHFATIRIHYSAPEPVKNVIAGIRITHLHGANIWGTNTKRRGLEIPQLAGEGFIDVSIDELPLLGGTYDLTIALSDESEVYSFDHWEKGLRFDVNQGKVFDEGFVTIPGKFSLS